MKEKLQKIGKTGTFFTGGLAVAVTITDYKQSYGRDRWLVTPLNGRGEVWTESVNFDK